MVTIKNGAILEQVELEGGYRVVAQIMESRISIHAAIRVFKDEKIISKNEMPEFVKTKADILYRKYQRKQRRISDG